MTSLFLGGIDILGSKLDISKVGLNLSRRVLSAAFNVDIPDVSLRAKRVCFENLLVNLLISTSPRFSTANISSVDCPIN